MGGPGQFSYLQCANNRNRAQFYRVRVSHESWSHSDGARAGEQLGSLEIVTAITEIVCQSSIS